MQAIIEQYRSVVIQIATPYNKGTGFYLKEYDLIVTNEHVVRGNKEVVIDGTLINRQLVAVVFIDQMYDLAFLAAPKPANMPAVTLGIDKVIGNGEPILAIGHPFGLNFTSTHGIISNTLHQLHDVTYYQHDAALNPGNSGGPLLDMQGLLIGVNTFVIRDGENIGFSLPISYLKTTIEAFQQVGEAVAIRCNACSNIVAEKKEHSKYCPFCGATISFSSQEEPYEPLGISKTIEEMLVATGHDIRLSRRGPNNWEIQQGSARINIVYHEKTGLIIGDAFLCNLPKSNIKPIYRYLLNQNYQIEGLTFSLNPKGQEIILSLVIHDRYLNLETGIQLFKHLFEKADHFDNILVEEYGAIWKNDRLLL